MFRLLLIALSSLAMLSFVPAASAADIIGRPSIIDGDTIEIHGQRVRLFGIDAPEHDQLCEAAGAQYRAPNCHREPKWLV